MNVSRIIINDLNIIAFIISFFILLIVLYRKSKTYLYNAYLLFQVCITIWTFGNIFDYLSTGILTKQFWMSFEYVGASFVGTLAFIISMIETKVKIKKHTICLAMVPSLTMMIAAITNSLHHMFCVINPNMTVSFKALFWINVYIQYAYIMLSVLIYIKQIIDKKIGSMQYIILILASIVPFAANTVVVFNLITTNGMDLTPLSFTISNILFSISIFAYGAFDIIPMATNIILKDIEQCIVISNQNNRIIEFNRAAVAFCEQFGVYIAKGQSATNLRNKIGNLDIEDEEKVNSFIKTIENKSSSKEKINVNMRKIEKYYEVEYSPILDTQDDYIGNAIIVKEVTEYIELYNDIQKRNEILELKNEEINKLYEEAKKYNNLANDFISIVSHEFRTPLNVITCSLQILDNNGDKTINDNRKWINMLNQNSLRLMKLINNLLDHSKIDAGFIELHESNIELNLFIKNIAYSIESYTKSKNIELEYIYSKNEIRTTIDAEKLEKIVLNLLSNATKFTKNNGKIVISLQDETDNFYITVKDNGIGIPKEEQEKIFKKFRQVDNLMTRHNEGSGIGLSLVQNFVKIMKGDITVKSEYGKGSEFIVCFPKKRIEIDNNISDKLLFENDLNQKIGIEFSDIS